MPPTLDFWFVGLFMSCKIIYNAIATMIYNRSYDEITFKTTTTLTTTTTATIFKY